MTTNKSIILTILLLGISLFSFAQEDLEKMVLLKNDAGRKYVFNRSTVKDGFYEISVKYFGIIKAKDSIYKVVLRSTIWGKNRHTSGAIYIYTNKNEYYGKYKLGDMYMLPEKINERELVFYNKSRPLCEPGTVTRISFKDGVPRELFIKCKNDMGDLYSFERN